MPGYVIEREGRGSTSNGEERQGRNGKSSRMTSLFCWRNEGLNSASDSLSRSGFPTPRETGRDR